MSTNKKDVPAPANSRRSFLRKAMLAMGGVSAMLLLPKGLSLFRSNKGSLPPGEDSIFQPRDDDRQDKGSL